MGRRDVGIRFAFTITGTCVRPREGIMITRHDFDTDESPEPDDPVAATHQRGPRTDPDMRDGDSGRGNPLEAGPAGITSDNDVGDTHPSAAADHDLDELPNVAAVPESETTARGRAEGWVEPHGPDTAPALRGVGGSYLDRQHEEAARTANPPRREGGDPRDRDVPIPNYPKLTVPEIIRHASAMSLDQLREVKDYEKSHRRRKTLLTKLERLLRGPKETGQPPADNRP
jgi:hypothetical protein